MEIYEYVHSIGNRMFPAYEIEEDGKEYQVDTACTIDFIVPHRDGQLDMSKFPFTKKQFLENTSVIRSLQALGINIEKFWVALLFVYYLTQKKTENVMAIPAPAFDQFRAFAKYLHANPDAKIRIWRGREHGVTIESQEAILMLGAILAENSATLFANLSRNVEFGLGDFSINLKDCYKITFVVACLLPFLEQFKAEDKRSTNPTQVSYNLMLLISRIVYMFGYTENKKYLDNDENIKAIWQRYKDEEWHTIGSGLY
ncbi:MULTISPECIES: hypothetical protein [Bacteroidales]|jgi:hypothetical protein|uniref:hypothetical protein n=1 Tax=Bacteroidales TaxID=171549 RepID=UPI001485BADE|nr:hypothetical protein [Alistipes shahii]MCO7107428.1 hypothetical protein [Alistipes shahii]